MSTVIDRVRRTLAEELRQSETLFDLALETRRAILNRSAQELLLLGHRHQKALERLEAIRESQKELLRDQDAQPDGAADLGSGLKTLLESLEAETELRQLERLRGQLEAARKLNAENAWLLEKQHAGVKVFHQVLDLVAGVDRIYDSDGELKRIGPQNRIEAQL